MEMNVTIVVRFTGTIEYVPLNLQTLKAGDWLQTVETFSDGTEPGTYDVKCARVNRSDSALSVSLRYDPGEGSNPRLAEDYPEMDWGTTTLLISKDLTRISAIFKPDGGIPFEGKCTLLKSSLYAKLSRGQINVLLRPGQSELRRQLMQCYGRCAITNECAKEGLEAAHLVEHHAGGSAAKQNGILLRADLHGLFDCGKLQISAEGEISLTGVPKESPYHSDLRERWNKTLPPEVLDNVRMALSERSKVRHAPRKSIS